MKKIAVVVEGHGDVESVPALIARTANRFDVPIITSEPPIRSGEAKKLRRPGELERFLKLAARRDGVEEIYVVLDLDDGCAKEYAQEFRQRASAISAELVVPVHFCFCIREYESILLADISNLSDALPDYGITDTTEINSPDSIRGAKEVLGRRCRGRKYRQSKDQVIFTRKIDVYACVLKLRWYRKLVKDITKLDYQAIMSVCETRVAQRV